MHGLIYVLLQFLTASISLSNGLLHGVSTIKRSDDVEVTYSSTARKLELHLPIVFSNLNFTYDYHLIILLIGPKGSMTGKIKNFKMDLRISFDFNTYQAKVESIKTTDTGHVDLIFHGNAILDLVVNILSEFVTTILHPLIVLVIEGIVKSVANEVVDAVNVFIDGVLHPNPETVNAIFKEKIYSL
ncbi:hypothetical protein NQ314_006518 [Rhamnusium bicolor]|uniref:Uncharacterized protein n=1 Tax=Rhamnusium bicolor TaxID=1586634 RepID=A0AAV8Z2Q4_9CUCU|nr:hypothetical protein NQ314_006518 [Rhamnusium bicolor]